MKSKIWIHGGVAECLELEDRLREAFGLKEAIVVPEPSIPTNVNKSLGVATGMYISESLTDDMSIGVGWGATLYEILKTLAPRQLGESPSDFFARRHCRGTPL